MKSVWIVSGIFLVIALLIFIVFPTVWPSKEGLWWNLFAQAIGLAVMIPIVYLIVETAIERRRRARLKAVEERVLTGGLSYSMSVIRRIGMFVGVTSLEPEPNENDAEAIRKTESFARKVVKEGLTLPHHHLQVQRAHEFLRETDNMLDDLFSLQRDYPFVFEEYPSVAKTLIDLRGARQSVKSAFYWYGAGDSINAGEHQRLVEQNLTKLVKVCRDAADTASYSVVLLQP